MTGRRRQMWHQDEEVQEAAHYHRNRLLEKSSKHLLVGHRFWHIRCQEKWESLFAFRFSLFIFRLKPINVPILKTTETVK